MTRSREMAIDFSGLVVIQNDSTVEEAGKALLAVLTGGTGNGSDRSRPLQIGPETWMLFPFCRSLFSFPDDDPCCYSQKDET